MNKESCQHKSITFKDKRIYIRRNKEEILNKCIKVEKINIYKKIILNILMLLKVTTLSVVKILIGMIKKL